MRLEGQVCVLTGATGGIGGAIAAELAQAGVRLVLSGRNVEALNALANNLSGDLGGDVVASTCAADLTTAEGRTRLIDKARQASASGLINVSGVNDLTAFDSMSDAQVERMVGANLTAPMLLTRHLLPVLQCAETPFVLNVGSAFDRIGHPGFVAYSASKFGLRGFSEALLRELAPQGVRVLHVSPRATRTPMNAGAADALNDALGVAQDRPERVARLVVRALRRGRARSAIGWPERFFARLNQLFPTLLDQALAGRMETIERHFPNPQEKLI